MDCLFLHDEIDICADSFEQALKKSGASYLRLTYSELAAQSLPTPKLNVNKSTSLLARFPQGLLTNRNNEMLLSMVLSKYNFSFVLDEQIYLNSFHQFEDKLYHSHLYERLNIPYAKVLDRKLLRNSDFPIIVKRRHSSLGKGNKVVKSNKDLQKLKKDEALDHHVFQKFHKLVGDYRVLLLGDELLGVVSRKIIRHKDGRVGVRVGKAVDLPKNVIDWCRRIKTEVPGARQHSRNTPVTS